MSKFTRNEPVNSKEPVTRGPKDQPIVYRSPVRLVIAITVSVFVSEAVVMILLSFLPPLSTLFEALLNATLLVVLLSPILYSFLFYPLVLHIAERRRATEALRESEERLSQIVRGVSLPVFVISNEHTVTHWNKACENLTGISADEILGTRKQWLAFYPAERAVMADLIVDGASEEDVTRYYGGKCRRSAVIEGACEVEDFFPHLGDRGRWLFFTAAPLRDIEGNIFGAIETLQDVTERKRTEEEIRQLSQFRESVIDDANVWLDVLDERANVVIWNKAAEEISGYSREEVVGHGKIWEWLYPDEEYRNEITAQAAAIIEGGVEEDFETAIRRKDGQSRIISWYSRNLLDESGDPIGSIALGRDVTERKRAQEALRQRTEEIELLYKAGQQLGQTLDIDTIYTRLHDFVSEIMDCDSLVVSSFDPKDKIIHCTFAIIEGKQQDASQFPPLPLNPKGQGTQSVAIYTGEALLIGDYQARVKTAKKAYYIDEKGGIVDHDQAPDQAPDDADVTRSGLVIPMKLEGQVVGVIQVGSYRLDAYTEGDLRILESLASQIAVAGNNALLYQQAQDEIVQRKRAEESLRESEEKYRAILESIADGYYEVDLAGNLVFFNDSLCRMLGYSPDELMGLNNREFMDDETARSVYQTFNGVHRTGKPARAVDWELIGKDGSRKFIEASVSLISDPVGDPTGFRGVARDVTERKQLEKQMRQQERLAAVGQLAGGIAHDFNNLLTAIILYAQLPLRQPDLPPDLTQSLEIIIDESHKAAELVQQILDFSRHAMIEVRPLDLKPFAGKVLDILQRTIPENIRLILAMGMDEYVVEVDPTRIQQALMNLATNGRDAMLSKEGGELRFALSRMKVKPDEKPPLVEMGPGEWVCLAVSDTGAGMTEEVRSHLFEPFFTTKDVGKGTGLGLAQVYGIVRQHKGYIGVETEIGQGTTFRIYLPACGAEEDVAEEQVVDIPRGRGEAVLLVEDSEKLREAGKGILESLGYRVLIAANGREALEVHEATGGIDLVITDLVMPEMGGKRLIRELRKADPDLKALAITGYIVEEDIYELREEGFLDVVYKPFGSDTLARVVRRALDEDWL